jgi:hypothetical protein
MLAQLRYRASIKSSKIDSRKLEAYLNAVVRKNDSRLILDADRIHVSNIEKMNEGFINYVYSFMLEYTERNEQKRLPLVIKIFNENIDPIFNSYIHDRDIRMCVREWEALTNLEHAGFVAPKAYFCECNPQFLGYPFLIMEKLEKSQKNVDDYLSRFAPSRPSQSRN